MFKEDYRRDMDALTLGAEGKEKILQAMEGRKSRNQKVGRTILLAAALCAALAVTALAVSPGLREALSTALGSFAPYSQHPQDISVENQGIQVKLVSTLADENGGVAYFEVTDLTDDRLDENTVGSGWLGCPIAYDPQTKTALYALDFRKEWLEGDGDTKSITTTFESFYSGAVKFEGLQLPWDKLDNKVLESQVIPLKQIDGGTNVDYLVEGHTVLVPEQTPVELNYPYWSLSSMGFDSNGAFHIQLKLAEDIFVRGAGEALHPRNINTPSKGAGWASIFFENGRYLDLCFDDLTPEQIGSFSIDDWYGTVYTKPPIFGEWTLEFQVPMISQREIKVGQTLHGCGIKVEQLNLSVRSIRFDCRYLETERPVVPAWKVALYLKDGSLVHIDQKDWDWEVLRQKDGVIGSNSELDHEGTLYGCRIYWPYPEAIDPNEITGVALGLWYLPLTQKGAGQGYWLDATP